MLPLTQRMLLQTLPTTLSRSDRMPVFREVARKKNALSKEECIKLLKEEKRGVLSVITDGEYPYCMPLNHYYDDRDGKIYFHSGRSGHKIDSIGGGCRACFCVHTEGTRKEGAWALDIKSVIVFGHVRIIDDPGRTEDISRRLSYKFTDDEKYIEDEIKKDLARTVLIELTIEHMTGKAVNES